MPRIDTHSQ